MSYFREVVYDAAIGVGIANRREALGVIHHSGVAAVIWRRSLDPALRRWLERLDPAHLPRTRVIAHRDDVREVLTEACDGSGTPDGPERRLFIDDAVELSNAFASEMRTRHLRLRLDVVTTNACRKFHVDRVAARLICTYLGPGTQYGVSTDGEDPKRIFTVATGAPILLRGALWRGAPRSGLLHRSPPIENAGETRLVLVLDPVVDPEDEA